MQSDDHASRVREMKNYGSIKSKGGEGAFLGMIRALEMGTNEFCIELTDRSPMCGEWQARFRLNGHDFDAEIVSFGYTDPRNVGNPHENARQIFNKKEIDLIKTIIEKIFTSPSLRSNISPFSMKSAMFTGDIFYKEGWIRELA